MSAAAQDETFAGPVAADNPEARARIVERCADGWDLTQIGVRSCERVTLRFTRVDVAADPVRGGVLHLRAPHNQPFNLWLVDGTVIPGGRKPPDGVHPGRGPTFLAGQAQIPVSAAERKLLTDAGIVVADAGP